MKYDDLEYEKNKSYDDLSAIAEYLKGQEELKSLKGRKPERVEPTHTETIETLIEELDFIEAELVDFLGEPDGGEDNDSRRT